MWNSEEEKYHIVGTYVREFLSRDKSQFSASSLAAKADEAEPVTIGENVLGRQEKEQ